MKLHVYDLSETEEWDKVVRSFDNYDVYWLSGYVRAFQLHGDGEPLLFYYEDKETKGINVVFKRDISCDSHFKNIIKSSQLYDFASPYGYGGWIIEGSERKNLFETYVEWCRGNNIVSEFVRFHPVIGNHADCDGDYEVISLGNTVTLDISSPEIGRAHV